jgi:Outer membrane protein beta-barrel domain
MYKPDEKDIDRLSREAAEHYRPPGMPDWNALQQALDKELPQQKEKKRRGFLFFFLLFMGLSLTGSVAWYGIHLYNSDKSKPLAAADKTAAGSPMNNKASTATDIATGNTSTDHSAGNIPAQGKSSNTLGDLPPGKATEAPVEATKTAAANTKIALTPVKPGTVKKSLDNKAGINPNSATTGTNFPIQPSTKETVPNGASNKFTANAHQTTARIHNKKPAFANSLRTKQNNGKTGTMAARPYNTKKQTGHKPGSTPDKIDQPVSDPTAANLDEPVVKESRQADLVNEAPGSQAIDEPARASVVAGADTATLAPALKPPAEKGSATSAKIPVKKAAATKEKAILVGLVAGMDLSTVKFTHNSHTGYNIGLMGGYQFSKRWSVYTGLIYTKKNYELNGSDYHPPKHYWTQYVKLNTVDGFCKMWEIPLLARYSFTPAAKTTYFVSTGLSSYIMKKQDYTYYYKTNAGVPGSSAWTNDSTFNHVFSILHLSAGIQKNIGKYMNWQIEPYAKIPLGGVGFGDIRLSSFGLNFSVQYRQPVKR